MTTVAFPQTPTEGQKYYFNDKEFVFSGGAWRYNKKDRFLALSGSAIDVSASEVFAATISTATTFTISGQPASGLVGSFILELTNGGAATITWFAGLKWANGTPPALTAAGVDVLGFYTRDGGATWRGMLLSQNSK